MTLNNILNPDRDSFKAAYPSGQCCKIYDFVSGEMSHKRWKKYNFLLCYNGKLQTILIRCTKVEMLYLSRTDILKKFTTIYYQDCAKLLKIDTIMHVVNISDNT